MYWPDFHPMTLRVTAEPVPEIFYQLYPVIDTGGLMAWA
jgi:hypothetical protein